MVFQEPRLLPWRTLEQNVRLAAPQVTDDELTTLFAALGLTAHRQHYPGELSLGLARRVALARASRSTPTCCCSTSRSSRSTTRWRRGCATRLAELVTRRPVTPCWSPHVEEAIALADRLFLLSPSRPASRPSCRSQPALEAHARGARAFRGQIARKLMGA